MKTLLTSILLLIVTCSYSQEIPTGKLEITDEGNVVFQEVVELPGKSKDEIYAGARVWMSEHFVKSKEVIDYESKEDGIISGRFVGSYYRALVHVDFYVHIKLEMKDEKLRFTLFDISNYAYGTPAEKEFVNKKGEFRGQYSATINDINSNANGMLYKLLKQINKNTSDENW